MRKLPLGLNERVLILKIWIVPLLNFTARAYQPNDPVIFHLRNIYWVGLKLTSWSVTLPILSQPPGKGGYNLLQPQAYLHCQFAHMFVSFIRQPHKLSADIVQPMTNWSKNIGLVLHPGFLPLLQIGITEWKHLPYLGLSGQSFSWLKQQDEPYASPLVSVQNLPLWHNALCRNDHHHTYHCP